jgi:hypothetical protein
MTQPTAPALSAEEQAKVDASGAVATALDTARSKLKAAGDELGKKVKDLNVATAKTRLTEATAELKTAREKIGGALESDRTGLTSQIEVIELAIAQQQTIVEGIEERAKDKEKDEAKEDDDY